MTRVTTGCEPVLVVVMLRHAWDMQPLSVPSHMQSGSSAPAMHLYSKQVRLMQIYSCYRFSGWEKIVHNDSQCDFQMPASDIHMQAFTTTQAQAVPNDQLCTRWRRSHLSHKLTLYVTLNLYLQISPIVCISVTSSELNI